MAVKHHSTTIHKAEGILLIEGNLHETQPSNQGRSEPIAEAQLPFAKETLGKTEQPLAKEALKQLLQRSMAAPVPGGEPPPMPVGGLMPQPYPGGGPMAPPYPGGGPMPPPYPGGGPMPQPYPGGGPMPPPIPGGGPMPPPYPGGGPLTPPMPGGGPVSSPPGVCLECLARDAFKKFLQKHNKSYGNSYDEEIHQKIFQDALKRIKELNQRRKSLDDARFGQTKFSDLDFRDFVKKFTGGIKETLPAEKFDMDLGPISSAVPLTFDWRDEQVVPEVRDQKECGSCYAFSSADLAAAQWAIDHGETTNYTLSPQFVLDCVHDDTAFGCDGGRPFLVLSTNANCTGENCAWPRESCYKYRNEAGSCTISECDEQPEIRVRQAYYVDVSSGGGEIQKMRLATLMQGGPVVALVAVTDHWQYYQGGVMRADQCQDGVDEANHAVLIVGYNYTDPNTSYYIVKNTWDKDWGEEGYLRMEAGLNACGIGQFLSFACTDDCGDGRSLKNLLDRARKRLEKKGRITTGATESPYAQAQTTGPGYYTTPQYKNIWRQA